MRTIKELLQIMLDNPQHFDYGLCRWAVNLYCGELITSEEYWILRNYIKVNKPFIFSSFDVLNQRISSNPYYWKVGKIEPRIEWLKKHINKNKL